MSSNSMKPNSKPTSIRSAAQVGSGAAAGPLLASSCAGVAKSQSFSTLCGDGRGPDGTTAQNSSLWSSGGASGSERSGCWAKSGNGQTYDNINNIHSVIVAKPGHIDIKLSGLGSGLNTPLSATLQSATLANYPPSPPAVDEELSGKTKALTFANVTALPSSFCSTISTTPTSEDDSDGSSELSFSTTSSSQVPSVAEEARFLASVFGPTYLSEFSKNGVKVVSLPQDVAEEAAFPFDSAVILASPVHDSKTLYYRAPADSGKLDREALVDLMEIAEEDLDCSGIVICLDRKEDKESLAGTLHSLMYVGGSIIAPTAGLVEFNSNDFILVGLDL